VIVHSRNGADLGNICMHNACRFPRTHLRLDRTGAGIYGSIDRLHRLVQKNLFAGFSGLIMMSRFNSIKVGYGNSYQLLTILVAIMGGVHPSGGQGKVMNVILSTLTLQCIASGFNILGFSNYIRNVIYGVVLITVMVVITIYPTLKQHFYLRNKC